jgi:hypothetical protein
MEVYEVTGNDSDVHGTLVAISRFVLLTPRCHYETRFSVRLKDEVLIRLT